MFLAVCGGSAVVQCNSKTNTMEHISMLLLLLLLAMANVIPQLLPLWCDIIFHPPQAHVGENLEKKKKTSSIR